MQVKLCLIAAFAIGLTACEWKQPNPDYCAPGAECNKPAPPCRVDKDCDAPLNICDPEMLVCVQCTSDRNDACVGKTPACGDDGQCRACEAHNECSASEACLPDGTCGDPAKIAYVKSMALGGTDGGDCSQAQPCTKLSKALTVGRPYVKVAGVINESATVTIMDQTVTLLAEPDAQLKRTTNGVILGIGGASKVEIYDLEISGASGNGGHAISMLANNTASLTLRRAKLRDNTDKGIFVEAGTVDISESTISGNVKGGIQANDGALTLSRSRVAGNPGGGLSMLTTGTFNIVGNVFYNNGNFGNVGGVAISTSQNSSNRLEFNSFLQNSAQAGKGAAIDCFAGTFTARNNIMDGGLISLTQVGGTCSHVYSIVRPGVVPTGDGNSGNDPLFKDVTTGDLHLQPNSPVLGKADPNSNLTGPAKFDIDGDERKAPADIGADEVP